MKRVISNFAFLFAWTLSGFSIYAQDIARGGFLNHENLKWSDPEATPDRNMIDIYEVNIAAARDFMKHYGKAEDVRWVKGKNGTSVYFTFDGLKMRSTYDNKGKREYTLKYYDESAMPFDVRHLVKSNYYDYQIEQVIEVERNGITYHIVKMQNEKEYLTVNVSEGEMVSIGKVRKIE